MSCISASYMYIHSILPVCLPVPPVSFNAFLHTTHTVYHAYLSSLFSPMTPPHIYSERDLEQGTNLYSSPLFCLFLSSPTISCSPVSISNLYICLSPFSSAMSLPSMSIFLFYLYCSCVLLSAFFAFSQTVFFSLSSPHACVIQVLFCHLLPLSASPLASLFFILFVSYALVLLFITSLADAGPSYLRTSRLPLLPGVYPADYPAPAVTPAARVLRSRPLRVRRYAYAYLALRLYLPGLLRLPFVRCTNARRLPSWYNL